MRTHHLLTAQEYNLLTNQTRETSRHARLKRLAERGFVVTLGQVKRGKGRRRRLVSWYLVTEAGQRVAEIARGLSERR